MGRKTVEWSFADHRFLRSTSDPFVVLTSCLLDHENLIARKMAHLLDCCSSTTVHRIEPSGTFLREKQMQFVVSLAVANHAEALIPLLRVRPQVECVPRNGPLRQSDARQDSSRHVLGV